MVEFSTIADILGIGAVIASILAWWQARKVNRRLDAEEKRLSQPITIVLKNGAEHIPLPAPIQRRFLTRAELLGRLGMIRPEKRFTLSSLNTETFFTDLDNTINGTDTMTLTIKLTDADYQALYGDKALIDPQKQPITIILKSGDKEHKLPTTIQRRWLTRAELLGRLGMINQGKRFDISFLNTPEFYNHLDEIADGKDAMTLTIELTDAEYQQLYSENS